MLLGRPTFNFWLKACIHVTFPFSDQYNGLHVKGHCMSRQFCYILVKTAQIFDKEPVF